LLICSISKTKEVRAKEEFLKGFETYLHKNTILIKGSNYEKLKEMLVVIYH